MSKLAYLSGPVSPYTEYWDLWYVNVEEGLRGLGFDVYRPDLAFNQGIRYSGAAAANRSVIDVCLAGVVLAPADGARSQTTDEIDRMLSRKLPVLIVTDNTWSVEMSGWRERGADVCSPGEVGPALEALGRSTVRKTPAESFSVRMMRMTENLQKTLGPVPLVFEPVSADRVPTSTGPQHLLPSRGYADDAGLDLYVSRDVIIDPYEFCDVPCGVKVDIPAGHWGLIAGRSSTLRKRGLLVNPGVIDAGWTGELFAGVQNLGGQQVEVSAGDRLAQLILLPAPVIGREPEWGRVPKKDRGENGFGSTGN